MNRRYLTVIIVTLFFSLFVSAEDKLNLASILEGGSVVVSEPTKDSVALQTILDGVTGTGGVVFTFGPSEKGSILIELGGNSLNKIDEVVFTAKVPIWTAGQAPEIKVKTAEKAEGPFVDAGSLKLTYSGALGSVFEPRVAKYVLLEFGTTSSQTENVIIEEVEIYGVPLDEPEPEPERVLAQSKINLFEHLGLEIKWELTGFAIVSPEPHEATEERIGIDVKTSDIKARFNVDGRLASRANLTGNITTPKNWEKLFLPETHYVRCYYLEEERAWLVGSQTLILNEMNNEVELTLSLGANRSWPNGDYRIEFYVGENPPLTYYFSIEEARVDVDTAVDGAGDTEQL